MNNNFIAKLIAIMVLVSNSLYGQEEPPIQVQVQSAQIDGIIKVRVKNKTTHIVSIWNSGNSWGWSNWTFEFFNGNELIVFVRKPDAGFTLNILAALSIPKSGFVDLSFKLNDGSWVSHKISIFPTHAPKEIEKNEIKGCFAVLAIPPSPESKEKTVWAGTVISPLH